MEYKSSYNPQLNKLQGGLSKNLAHNNSENELPHPAYNWQPGNDSSQLGLGPTGRALPEVAKRSLRITIKPP